MAVKPKINMRTFNIGIRANKERPRDRLVAQALEAAVTAAGVASRLLLERLWAYVAIVRDDSGELKSADLFLPLTSPERVARAQSLVAQAQQVAPLDRGIKEAARPQYKNSYHMEEVLEREGLLVVRCRVAERFSWIAQGGAQKGRQVSDVDIIDAKVGLQGLLKTWVSIDWGDMMTPMQVGVCQQAAQQFNSHIGLLAEDRKASFPSLLLRDPAEREWEWRAALARVATSTYPLERLLAREVNPAKYGPDDPRGDRLVTTEPDWRIFARSPNPERHPLTFVKQTDVVVYWCRLDHWLYAAVPLGRLAQHPQLQWWKKIVQDEAAVRKRRRDGVVRDAFRPLGLWRGQRLSARQNVLLVQLETRNPRYLMRMFSGRGGRVVNWSLITEKLGTRGRQRNRRQWVLHLATSRKVMPRVRPNVLGIHFGTEPVLWWALMDVAGVLRDEGSIEQNEILAEGLRRQLRLQEEQGRQRWVGEKRFAKELRRRTDEVAKRIVAPAARLDANLALEDIKWVEKRRGGPDLNRRHSMWNFSQLPERIEWLGLERRVNWQDDPVVTVYKESDYVLSYTCPACGACRKAKQKPDKATTWRTAGVLHCRKCSFEGPVPDLFQAQLVARPGVAAAAKLRARLEEED